MSIDTLLTLFAAMLVLALIPGVGVLVVIARSLSSGFRAGIMTSCGIVAGDYVFIILSVVGLATIAETMTGLFIMIKYLGAAYLFWLGTQLLFPKNQHKPNEDIHIPAHQTHFITGLTTTLSNPKAILFYLSFFPAFLDLSRVSAIDMGILLLIATVTVGGVMVMYAYLACSTKTRFSPKTNNNKITKMINYISGSVLIGSGAILVTRN
ncbi:MAG: threonine/homoserine/homoserine lactone efflux protein [Kiritimatiellia bacterium]|jgi:threonine/homoserine/homoserine lactone efflux protein